MSVSKVPSRGKPELCGVSISATGLELSEAVGTIGLTVHKGAKGNWFRGNTWKDIKGMGQNDVREVRDYGNAVPGIRNLVARGVNGQGRMRKSEGRVRM
jgi:hypothetical protein